MCVRRNDRSASSGARPVLIAAIAIIAAAASITAISADLGFDLQVRNGRVPDAMRTIRVNEGDRVTLRFTADRPLVVHLHGYEIESRVQPAAESRMAFTARLTGRFPIHAHSATGADGAQDESTLAYVEVYPR